MFSVMHLKEHQVLIGWVTPSLGATQNKTPKAELIISYQTQSLAVSGVDQYLKQRFVAWKM